MLAPRSIFEPEPLGLCQQCSHNLIHDSFIARTYAATVSLLGASWNLSVGKKKEPTSRVSEWKVRYKRETIGRQRNVTFGWVSAWRCSSRFPFSLFFSPLFCPSLPPLLQVSPALINANLCSLAGTTPAGRGPLPWLPAVKAGGAVVGMGGWGEGDLDRHLI